LSSHKLAAKSGLWFAVLRTLTQTISWVITVAIARILNPEDYGLMALVGVVLDYLAVFSELGLGAAIIQKDEITSDELSSNFWLSVFLGCALALISVPAVFSMSWMMKEPRLIVTTPLIVVLFVVGSLMIVPFNLLMRECKFKEIGVIQLWAVIASSLSMLALAEMGFGFWSLIWGMVVLRVVTVALVFLYGNWWPDYRFRIKDVKPFLRFGIHVAGSRSLYSVLINSDKLIVGKILGAEVLGFYSFAMNLVSIPSEKIVSLVNQISFPVISRVQNDVNRVQYIYIRITRYITMLVAPMFLGGFFFGREIVQGILGEKWLPVVYLFKMLCLSQLIVSLTTIDSVVHNAQGRSHWVLNISIVYAALIPASIFLAAHFGLNALVLPWLIFYPFLRLTFTYMTLRKLDLAISSYIRGLLPPILGSFFMIVGIYMVQFLYRFGGYLVLDTRTTLVQEVITGVILYLVYLYFFERKNVREILALAKS